MEHDLFGQSPVFHVGEAAYEPGSVFGPRQQRNLQLIYIYEGSVEVMVDHRPNHVAAGQAMLLLPNHQEYFTFDRVKATRHGWCEVIAPTLTAAVRDGFSQLPLIGPLTGRMRDLMTMAVPMRLDTSPASQRLLDALTAAIFYDFLLNTGFQADDIAPLPGPLRQAVVYLQQHLGDCLTLTVVAKEAGVTSQHLNRLSRQHLGKPLIHYLWELRVREGARLLTATGLSISEVAYRCGFATPNHFSRLVKQRYGLPPTRFRQRAWET